MAGERIDDLSDAKRLREEYRSELVASFLPDVKKRSVVDHTITGVGMDGIEVDFVALRQAEQRLASLHDELIGHLRMADELGEPLRDGTSPVTGPMRKAFARRVNVDTGVKAALLDYMSELMSVRGAIIATLGTYDGVDAEAENRFQRQLDQIEEIA